MSHKLLASGANGARSDLLPGELVELEEQGYVACGGSFGREEPSLIALLFPRLLAHYALHFEFDEGCIFAQFRKFWKFALELESCQICFH